MGRGERDKDSLIVSPHYHDSLPSLHFSPPPPLKNRDSKSSYGETEPNKERCNAITQVHNTVAVKLSIGTKAINFARPSALPLLRHREEKEGCLPALPTAQL